MLIAGEKATMISYCKKEQTLNVLQNHINMLKYSNLKGPVKP